MTASTDTPGLILNQSLFGYDDGHRLLATSLPARDPINSFLLPLSDLAPRTQMGRSDGYWSAIPVADRKAYALLRTWPAPELPRPGCVWTHAIVFDMRALGEVEDLCALRQIAVDPRRSTDRSTYGQIIRWRPPDGVTEKPPLNAALALQALRATYGNNAGGIVGAGPGEADDVIFALWSQQWRSLRATFSFRTAVSPQRVLYPGLALDLQISPLSGHSRDHLMPPALEPWERVALDDLILPRGSALRRFLWTYGGTRAARDEFRRLCGVYAARQKGSLIEAIEAVYREFPEPEASHLTAGLLRTTSEPLSATDALVLLALLAEPPRALPASVAITIFDNLRELLPQRSAEVSNQLQRLSETEPLLVSDIESRLASSVAAPILFSEVFDDDLRQRLLIKRPELLATDEASVLSDKSLLELTQRLPEHALSVFPFANVLNRDGVQLARSFLDLAADEIVPRVLAASERGDSVAGAWWRAICSERAWLNQAVALATRASTLLELCRGSRLHISRIDPLLCAQKLTNLKSDLHGMKRAVFKSYIVALALAAPQKGVESLLQYGFATAREHISQPTGNSEALNVLTPFLPSPGWWSSYSVAFRLDLAIAEVFVRANLDPRGFLALSQEKQIRRSLRAAMMQTPGGWRFLDDD